MIHKCWQVYHFPNLLSRIIKFSILISLFIFPLNVNAAITDPTPIPYFDSAFNVTYSGTVRWYSIDLIANQGITIALTSHLNQGGLDFGFYDSEEHELVGSNDSSISNGQTGTAQIVIRQSGTYYIKVWESATAVGNYDLAVYNAWFNEGVTDSGRDFNSTLYTAKYIQNGNYAVFDNGTSVDLGVQYYRFTVATNTLVNVSVTAHLDAGALDFGIFDIYGELASSNDSSITNGQTGSASKLFVEPGVYYVKVWESSDTSGNYDLFITGADADTDSDGDGLYDAAEYFRGTSLSDGDTDGDGILDSAELAQGRDPLVAPEHTSTDIGSATSIGTAYALSVLDAKNSIEHSGTTTWYSFSLNAGEGVTVALTAHVSRGSFDFGIFNASGAEIAGSNDSGISNGQTGTASVTVVSGGTYYVKVWEASDALGKYDLAVYHAWFNPGVTDEQREFYATFYTARYIQNGSYPVDSLDDYYRFTAVMGAQVSVSVTANLNRGALDFGIYNASGTEIAGSNDASITDGQTGVASKTIEETGVYYVRVWGGSDAEGSYDLVITGAEDEIPASNPNWVPLYRMYNGSIKDHFYTTSYSEVQDAKTKGYSFERIECYVACNYFTGSVPMYRLWHDAGSHYYTTDKDERDYVIETLGFVYEGVAGWVCATASGCAVPLYHLYHETNKDHFFTMSEFERDHAVSAYGFVNKDVTMYVSPSPYGTIEPESIGKSLNEAALGINPITGAFNRNFSDLAMPGIREIPFGFVRTYNSFFRLHKSPVGYGWTHSYNTAIYDDGNIIVVRWGDGREDYYQKEGTSYVPWFKWTKDSLTKDGSNYTITKKDQTVYHFEPIAGSTFSALLISIVDRNGNTKSVNYDGSARISNIVDTTGRTVAFSYNDANDSSLITSVIAPLSHTVLYAYDTDGNLTNFTDPEGTVTTYEYDADHQLTKIIMPRGNELNNTYTNGRVTGQLMMTPGENRSYEMSYDTGNYRSVETLPGGSQVARTFDSRYPGYDSTSPICMQVLSQIDDAKQKSAYLSYSDSDNPLSPTEITDRKSNDTAISYDADGNIRSITNALTETTTFTYDGKNNPLTATDPLNHTTTFTYDYDGNRTSATNHLNQTTNYTYTSQGLLSSRTDPEGRTTSFTYDAYGNLTQVTDDLSNTVDYTYDAVGRMMSFTTANNKTFQFAYDKTDNLVNVTDPTNGVFEYAYDENGNLSSIEDAKNNITEFEYYADRDLLKKETDPLLNAIQYAFNDNGTLHTINAADGSVTTFGYDANSRVTDITYHDNSTVNFQYDDNGNVTDITDGVGNTHYSYDSLNRITVSTGPYGKSVAYGYDEAGRMASSTYPGSKTVTYAYDEANRLWKVTDWLNGETVYAYDDSGLLINVDNPDGTTTEYSYDGAGRLNGVSIKKSDNTVIASYSYTLDAAGNHTQAISQEPIERPLTTTDIAYSYDDADRLTSSDGVTFTHDVRGNLTGTNSGNSYTFDYADRLKAVNIGGEVIQYLYDGAGNRIARTKGGVQTRYVLDTNGPMTQVLAEMDSSGTIINYYVYGLGLISKITVGGQRYCYHFDSLGSTVAITHGSQNIVNEYVYDEFGKVMAKEEGTPNPFRYVGQYGVMDEDNGLLFMRARYYDTDTGRFLSKDPLRGEFVEPGTLNRYVYVLGNPLMGVDPEGESLILTSFVIITTGVLAISTVSYVYDLLSKKRIRSEKQDWADEKIRQFGDIDSENYFVAQEYSQFVYKKDKDYLESAQKAGVRVWQLQ